MENNVNGQLVIAQTIGAAVPEYVALDPQAEARETKYSKAENTKRAYKSAWAKFGEWCKGRGLNPLPTTGAMLANYLGELSANGLKLATIGVHRAAIRLANVGAGYTDPSKEGKAVAQWKAIAREIAEENATAIKPQRRVTKKQAATLDTIQRMVDTQPDTLAGKRNKALLLVGFAGAFRRSELANVKACDLSADIAGGVNIYLPKSKTDQNGKGFTKHIPLLTGKYCPTSALVEWISAAGIKNGYVFLAVNKGDNITGEPMSGEAISNMIKKAASAAGLDPKLFAGHSLRRGFVTEAKKRNKPNSDIMAVTGHKNEAVLAGYNADTSAARATAKSVFGE